MEISNRHNLIRNQSEPERRYGIKVRVAASDPFQGVLNVPLETYYWYADAAHRDEAIREKSARHVFSRLGDVPTVMYEPVER
jgi:hypothetical protein